eukprot:3028956-Rhodomonas_salina.1
MPRYPGKGVILFCKKGCLKLIPHGGYSWVSRYPVTLYRVLHDTVCICIGIPTQARAEITESLFHGTGTKIAMRRR